MSDNAIIDITATDAPLIYVPRAGTRFFISRKEALLLMCKVCGGAVAIILHIPPAEAWLPPVKQCKCEVKCA